LTANSGMYQEISTGDSRYLSNAAVWEVNKKTPSKLVATGRWWDIPIVQTVEIELEDYNTIVYNIRTNPLRKIDCAGEALIVALSGDFDSYLVPYSGKRSLFSSLSGGVKEATVFWEGEVRFASSVWVFNSSQGMSLALDCSLAPPDYISAISHTTGDNEAPILMCRKVNNPFSLEPREYSFPTMKVKVLKRRGL